MISVSVALFYFALLYLLALNIIGFVLCGSDKSRARKSRLRIPERMLLLIGLLGGCFGLLLGMGVFRHKTGRLKFMIAVPLECVLWAVMAIHIISALTLDRQLQYLEISYPSAKISAELDGYTVAFVSDTHSLPAEELREIVRRINGYAPDLLLLGGDFPSFGGAAERSMEILSKAQTVDGIYGVEGNHDNFSGLFAAMRKYGVTPLANSGVAIRGQLYLAGVEDLWNRSPDIAAATKGAGEGDFVLLLSHNPDVTMQQGTENLDLVLSGHTHGGHVTLFGVLAPMLAWSKDITGYGQRFMSGWAKSRDGVDVLVSNGTGCVSMMPRIFARPQVIVLTLKHMRGS
jgi:predicted MPP superfamily phosphohydrolase